MSIETLLKQYGSLSAESMLNRFYGNLDLIEVPIEPENIVALLPGVRIEYGHSWDDLVKSGYIKVNRDPNGFVREIVIWANPSEASVRRRFTYAHELGHLVYDVIPNLYNSEYEEIIDVFNRDQRQTFIETRANNFAAELLMPFELVKREIGNMLEVYAKNTNGQKPPVDEGIQYLSRQFNVSNDAMRYRLLNLGYLS
ncbi:ImmA/IrrE family metallo-endopeptidase [Shewanella algae]|uniref:ImmA/IrrE family metallo-endopeptidase n=1 Tax=Shewanella algae TaxID=38313 RepID=UPI0031F5CF43